VVPVSKGLQREQFVETWKGVLIVDLKTQNQFLKARGLPQKERLDEELLPSSREKLLQDLDAKFRRTKEKPSREAVDDYVTFKAILTHDFRIETSAVLRQAMGQPEPLPREAIRANEVGVIRGWLKGHLIDDVMIEPGKVPVLTAEQREKIEKEHLRSHVLGRRGVKPFNDAETLHVEKQIVERLGVKVDTRKIVRALEDDAVKK
jgi:hypothetical protein